MALSASLAIQMVKEKKKNIEEENGKEMTRYGVCLIPERREVSLPGGLWWGDVSAAVYFFLIACQSCSTAT